MLVDDRLRTSDPDIFAAGDMVEVCHKVSGRQVRSSCVCVCVLRPAHPSPLAADFFTLLSPFLLRVGPHGSGRPRQPPGAHRGLQRHGARPPLRWRAGDEASDDACVRAYIHRPSTPFPSYETEHAMHTQRSLAISLYRRRHHRNFVIPASAKSSARRSPRRVCRRRRRGTRASTWAWPRS